MHMKEPMKQFNSRFLHEEIGMLVSRGRERRALELLRRIIEESLPLFQSLPWELEERRLAWLYRIDLLRDLERMTEALAWACLEVEMNPGNVAAVALKERLKRASGLLPWNDEIGQRSVSDIRLSPGKWVGVAGMRDLKAMLERDVILPLLEPEIYRRYRLEIPNGILLYGPPGCGKTFIARKLADVSGFSFMEVKPGDLASIYVHGTQGEIAKVFAKAQEQSPCMIFLDELDAMVPNRGGGHVGHHYSSEVNEFLARLNECSRNGILVIGATNLPERIDPAAMRPGRLDKKFFVGPPDYEARMELLRLYMANRPQQTLDWHRCALELENYTCAEIEFIVNEAARNALVKQRPIIIWDILHAAGNNPPAHSPEQIEKMRGVA